MTNTNELSNATMPGNNSFVSYDKTASCVQYKRTQCLNNKCVCISDQWHTKPSATYFCFSLVTDHEERVTNVGLSPRILQNLSVYSDLPSRALFRYYDATGTLMTAPGCGPATGSIRRVDVAFVVQTGNGDIDETEARLDVSSSVAIRFR